MIRINAKSAPEEIQLMARVKSGFKNIEIQLINKEIAKEEYDITKKMIEEGKRYINSPYTIGTNRYWKNRNIIESDSERFLL